MRTNIDIDDCLMRQALRASGRTTKRGMVDEALKLLVQTRSQAGIPHIAWPHSLGRQPRGQPGHPVDGAWIACGDRRHDRLMLVRSGSTDGLMQPRNSRAALLYRGAGWRRSPRA